MKRYEHRFETQLAARRYMADLDLCKVRYDYYIESACSYFVVIYANKDGKQS